MVASDGGRGDNGSSEDPQLSLEFEIPDYSLDKNFPCIEGVLSLGAKLSVKTRGDGSCFFSATTVEALLEALCAEGSAMLECVAARFHEAVYGGTWGKQLPSVEGGVKVWMEYFEGLLRDKMDANANNDFAKSRVLVARLIKDLYAPTQAGGGEPGWCGQLYRGMVVAGRMAAIMGEGKDIDKQLLRALCTVGTFRVYFPEMLERGSSLGVRLELMEESGSKGEDKVIVTSRYFDARQGFRPCLVQPGSDARRNGARLALSPHPWVSNGISVRSGGLSHYKVHVDAASTPPATF